jgi:hypothetical protein
MVTSLLHNQLPPKELIITVELQLEITAILDATIILSSR